MKKYLRLKRILPLILLLALAAGLAAVAPWGRRVYDNARTLQSLAARARALKAYGLQPDSLPLALDMAREAADATAALQADLAPLYPWFQKLGPVPRLGPYALAVEPGLAYLENLTRAALLLGQAALSLIRDGPGGADPSLSPLEKAAALLAEYQPGFDQAEAHLQQADLAAARIDPAVIPPAYLAEFQQANALVERAPLAFDALRAFAPLLGSPSPCTYLLLVQNRDELRPSGGFISAFGLLRLDAGRISMLEVNDSTLFDYVSEVRPAPEPIEKIMLASYLVARDANWSPDFPTAARQVQDMYFVSTAIPTEGVIAIDQGFIVRLMAFLGPVAVPDEQEPISAANVEARMIAYKQAAIDDDRYKERKEFLSVLAPYMIQKLYAVSSYPQQAELARILLEAAREGHLLAYFNDPAPQAFLRQAGLDGSVAPAGGDFLMLVDANLGIDKVDQFIQRSLLYEVDLQDPSAPAAALHLRYVHTQPGSDPCQIGGSHDYENPEAKSYYFSRCYWDYWRVLTAGGAILQGSDAGSVPLEYFGHHPPWPHGIENAPGEGGTHVFAGLLVVPQAQQREVVLNFLLPPSVLRREGETLAYRLRLQKQAGIENLPVELWVAPPQGTVLLDPPDSWTCSAAQKACAWQGEVTRSIDLELQFTPAAGMSAAGAKE